MPHLVILYTGNLDAVTDLSTLCRSRPVGVTLQIDEGPEVVDAKNSALHPLFMRAPRSG